MESMRDLSRCNSQSDLIEKIPPHTGSAAPSLRAALQQRSSSPRPPSPPSPFSSHHLRLPFPCFSRLPRPPSLSSSSLFSLSSFFSPFSFQSRHTVHPSVNAARSAWKIPVQAIVFLVCRAIVCWIRSAGPTGSAMFTHSLQKKRSINKAAHSPLTPGAISRSFHQQFKFWEKVRLLGGSHEGLAIIKYINHWDDPRLYCRMKCEQAFNSL